MKLPTKPLTATLAAFAVVVALSAWWLWVRQPPLPDGLIQANGRIEGDHYAVAGKVPGKVAELLAREGDVADKGKVLLRLDDTQLRARVDQAHQAIAALEAQRRAAQTSPAVARKDVPLAIQSAEAGLANARAAKRLLGTRAERGQVEEATPAESEDEAVTIRRHLDMHYRSGKIDGIECTPEETPMEDLLA